jgi:hypothetical protein
LRDPGQDISDGDLADRVTVDHNRDRLPGLEDNAGGITV